jgi:hypothetical protein
LCAALILLILINFRFDYSARLFTRVREGLAYNVIEAGGELYVVITIMLIRLKRALMERLSEAGTAHLMGGGFG